MKKVINCLCLLCTGLILSCTQEVPMLSLGVDDIYVIPRMKVIYFNPAFIGESYQWSIKASDGSDSIVSTQKEYIFLPEHYKQLQDMWTKIIEKNHTLIVLKKI